MHPHTGAPLHSHCQNCETPLTGPFCSRCGQRDFEFHQSFGHALHEAIETWFHVDHSFFRGFYDILFAPGKMTREFNEGKRARHVPPFRFYLVISLLFFFVVLPHDVDGRNAQIILGDPDVAESAEATTKTGRFTLGTEEDDSPRARELKRNVEEKINNPRETIETYLRTLPKAMLVCVPIFALITRVLHWRGRYVYLQHLILSLHLHTFLFLWSIVTSGWIGLVDLVSGFAALLLMFAAALYPFWYYFATLHRVLQISRRRSLFTGLVAGTAYVFVISLGLSGMLMVMLLY